MAVREQDFVDVGKRLLRWTVALAGSATAPWIFAQSLPDAGQLLNEHQQSQPSAPQSTEPPPAFELPTDAVREGQSGLRVTLRSIRFSGDTELAEAEDLQRLVNPMVGKTLDHAGLQQLTDSLTRYLRGRGYVLPDDVKAVAPDVLRHRIITSFEAEAEEVTSDNIISRIFEAVDVP